MIGYKQILSIRTAGSANEFEPIGCLQSDSLSEGVETINSILDVGGWTSTRNQKQFFNISFEGVTVLEPGINSYSKIRKLKRDKTLIEFEITNEFTNYKQTGKGYVVSVSQDAPIDDLLTFQGEITGYGEPMLIVIEIVTFDSTVVTFDSTDQYF